jgi:hypothetical protein
MSYALLEINKDTHPKYPVAIRTVVKSTISLSIIYKDDIEIISNSTIKKIRIKINHLIFNF